MGGGKIKTRIKTKSAKTRRWKKGHSSDSNPKIRSHRDSAKSSFFNVQTGPSQLTVEALAKHDQTEHSVDAMDTVSDSRSDGGLTGHTFNTWASNWTECTNATFSKVHQFWNSSSALHKEILAVLAAITEVIKSQGGAETETSYFAALMTTLTTVDEDMSLAATTYLLSLAIKRVPVSVLKSRFSEVSKVFFDTLAAHTDTETPALLRHLLMCLAHLLRVQDHSVWSYSSTTQLYTGLLTFTVHPKPKVRKAAQHAVRIVLKASTFMTSQEKAVEHHPAASITAKYCVHQIESSGGGSESTATLHVLGLLQHVLAVFPHKSFKHTCETILKVMTLANVIVNSTAFKTLHAMFIAQPKESSLPAELNAQLITALYDYQPSENDSQQMAAWLAVMERAHIHLYSLNPELCLSHVSKLFCLCMKCLQNNNPALCRVTAQTAKTLLKECVQGSVEYLKRNLARSGQNSTVYKMFKAAEAGLSYQYHASWNYVLHILTTFYEVAAKECSSIMKKSVLTLADLRDSHQFAYQQELDVAMGMAVRHMGPRLLLDAVPLQITGENDNVDFGRSWLLPVMRDSIQNTELAFFATYFLPLASKLRTKAIEYANKNEEVRAKTYDALQLQMWSLLPGFCTSPTDFMQSFKEIARYLGMALSDRVDLQRDVMISMRKLLKQSETNDQMKTELGKFSKNYLPILFNLFCQSPESEKDLKRLSFLETMRAYLPVTAPELVDSYFDRCAGKLDDAGTTGFKQHAYLDLTIAMIPHINSDRLRVIYHWAVSKLKSTDKTLQKKCYKALHEICSSQSADSHAFVQQNIADIQDTLVTSLSSACPSAKAPRLGCLVHIFKQLDVKQTEFLMAVIPEAVSCVKAVGDRARRTAYELLIEMARAMVRWSSDDAAAVAQYVQFVMGGTHESPQMVPCVVLTLTRLVYEFKAYLDKSLLHEITRNACTMLKSKSRETIIACFGLLKVLLSICQDTDLAPHLKTIVSSLVSMETDNKHHFRFKTKDIYQKLVRKFGYNVIFNMVPESQQKQLKNIKKTTERAQRKKKEASEESGDETESLRSVSMPKVESIEDLLQDSDADDDTGATQSKKGKKNSASRKKTGQAWLREGAEEDIVDFLDASVAKKVLGTKPGADPTTIKVKHDFKTSTDGRLIITDANDDDASDNKKNKKKALKRKLTEENEEDDDLEELMGALSGHHIKNKKTKKSAFEDVNDDDDTKSVSSTYRPGGRGIHRPLKQADKPAQRPGDIYKSKKAGGDVKRKDKPDPYAYIPLEMNLLNKRKRAKAAGQFKNLVTGAKKGAKKGAKQRRQKSKK